MTETPNQPGRAYHYVLTVQYQVPGGGIGMSTASGVITPKPGATSEQAYQHAMRLIGERNTLQPGSYQPILWSLLPNDL